MKLTVIIPVTEHASDTEKANGPLLRKLLHPDTQLEFVSIERGFPAIESDLHAVFNVEHPTSFRAEKFMGRER